LLNKTVSGLEATIVAAIKMLRAAINVRAIVYVATSIAIALVN
jgi:hypothetical protein